MTKLFPEIKYDYSGKYFYIYHIVFNKRGYIGSTKNPRQRILSHIADLRNNKHSNPILQNAWNKYGNASIKINIIFKGVIDYRNKIEEYFINISNFNSDYNILSNCDSPIKPYNSDTSKVSKSDIENIFKEVNSGKSLVDVGKEYGISKENVRSIIFKIVHRLESKDIPDIDIDKYKKDRKAVKSKAQRKFFKRKLFVYSINGILLYEFNNVVEAVEKLNVTNSDIFNSISRKHQHKGMIFSRTRLNFSKYEPKWNTRKIIIFNEEFNRINDFNSMKECANFYEMNVNTINSNCNRMTLNTKLNLYFVRDNKLEVFKDKYSIKD